MQYGLIMAGGSGTRLWPFSRKGRPKQLLPVLHGKSLLQLAYDRLRGILPPENIYVCTGATYRQPVLDNLPELPPANLLGEPMGRDTANAVGFGAAVLHKRDPQSVMAVVTADHVIEPAEQFQSALKMAYDIVAEQPQALVTFGIIPTHGHPGMGYINRGDELMCRCPVRGAYHVLGFKEKPDKPTADRYVESERYYWNSGMFVWRCDTILEELARYLPDSHRGLARIAESWGTAAQDAVLAEVYPRLPKISIDYAVLERVAQNRAEGKQRKGEVITVEMPLEQWLDVGSWPALAETLPTDDHDNAVDCPVHVLVDSDNNIVVCEDPDHLVAAIGLSDMIVVHTRDVTLVCPKADAERVRQLVDRVKERFGDRYQ